MTDERMWGSGKIWAARLVLLAVFFVFWEWAANSKLVDPILIGKPTGIVQYLWQEVFVTQSLLNDFYWSMGGTMIAFVLGSVAGVLVGMLFVTSPIDGSGVQPDLHRAERDAAHCAGAAVHHLVRPRARIQGRSRLQPHLLHRADLDGGGRPRRQSGSHHAGAHARRQRKPDLPQVRAAERRAGDLQRPAGSASSSRCSA